MTSLQGGVEEVVSSAFAVIPQCLVGFSEKLKGGGGIATGVPIGMVLQREPLIRSNDGLDSGSLIDFENHVKVLCNRRRRHLASEDGSPQGSGGFSSITHDGGDRCLAQSSIAVRTSSQTHIPVLTVLQRGI